MVNENTYAEKWFDRKIPRIVLSIFFTGAASICFSQIDIIRKTAHLANFVRIMQIHF